MEPRSARASSRSSFGRDEEQEDESERRDEKSSSRDSIPHVLLGRGLSIDLLGAIFSHVDESDESARFLRRRMVSIVFVADSFDFAITRRSIADVSRQREVCVFCHRDVDLERRRVYLRGLIPVAVEVVRC